VSRARQGFRPSRWLRRAVAALALGGLLTACGPGTDLAEKDAAASTGESTSTRSAGADETVASDPPAAATTAAATTGPDAAVSTGAARTSARSGGRATGRPSAPSAVDVLITYSGFLPSSDSVEVGGLASGVVEADGRCTLTLSRPGHADVTVSSTATPDADNTACGALTIAADRVDSGSWTARITYRSSTSSGSSAPATVQVP
jgi:hypothetical protein